MKYKMLFEGEIEIELDNKVISAVNDEWRKVFYDLNSPEEIARHIAYNMIVNRLKLSHLDGWANQPDLNATIVSEEWYIKES